MSLRDQLDRIESKLDRVLDLQANSDCPQGCKCVFCREFDRGVASAREDAFLLVSSVLGGDAA